MQADDESALGEVRISMGVDLQEFVSRPDL